MESLGANILDGVAYFKEIIVGNLMADNIKTNELCVEDICVTREKFKEVFGVDINEQTDNGIDVINSVIVQEPIPEENPTEESATSTSATSTEPVFDPTANVTDATASTTAETATTTTETATTTASI